MVAVGALVLIGLGCYAATLSFELGPVAAFLLGATAWMGAAALGAFGARHPRIGVRLLECATIPLAISSATWGPIVAPHGTAWAVLAVVVLLVIRWTPDNGLSAARWAGWLVVGAAAVCGGEPR